MRLEIGRKRLQKGHKFDHGSAVYTMNKLSTSDPYLFHKKSQKIYCVRKCLISAYLTGPPRAFPVTLKQ